MFHDRNYSEGLDQLKEEAREEGYQQGYLDALNDIEQRIQHAFGPEIPFGTLDCRQYSILEDLLYGKVEELRKMVNSR